MGLTRSRILIGCLNLASGIWARFVVTNGHHIDTCFNGVGLCAQILDNLYKVQWWIHKWEGLSICDLFKEEERRFALRTFHIFYISTSIQKFGMTICAFHNCETDGTIPSVFLQSILFVGLEMLTTPCVDHG